MSMVVAHAGHWLIGLGFAGAPLTVIAGIVAIAAAERRRGAQPDTAGPAAASKPT